MNLSPPPTFRGRFLVDEEGRALYADASGILRWVPRAVAIPEDRGDVVALARWAAATGTPLVPRGAGTGMPGGNVGPGVAVDMVTGFQEIHEVDPERSVARVGPGVTLERLNAAAAPHGLHLPVDPSSGARCTLGGMVANNSAGAHSVRYGATRAWVEEVEAVLADGASVLLRRGAPPPPPLVPILHQTDAALLPRRGWIEERWPRVRKNASGYALAEYLRTGDALDLVVGSEGTLALVTGATLRLAPRPAAVGLALLEFTTLEDAGAAVARLLPLEPATCEMLDRTFLELVRQAGADAAYPLRPRLEAILLVEVEAPDPAGVADRLEDVANAVAGLARHAALAAGPEEQERLWHLRHAASPLIAAQAGQRVSMQFIEDGVVPVERLPDYVRLLRDVLARHHLPAVIFGHAGDGNLHVNPLVDVTRPDWARELEGVLDQVAEGVAALGGTLSGEHGDGRLRAPHLATVWGDEMVELFRAVKRAFDPAGLLNPGVILPLPGQRPFDALRAYPR